MARGFIVSLILLGVASLGYFYGQSGVEDEPSADSVVVVKDTPNVITAIKSLAKIEGAALHVERVIDLREKQSRFFGLVEAEDAILLVAAGDVTAGVDLARLAPQDIQVDDAKKSARIVLPRATFFSVRVDSERTYVHTRSTDILAEEKMELETKARQEAERGFREAAETSHLLERAEDSVARTVQALVRSLGFEEVEVTFVDVPPAGSER